MLRRRAATWVSLQPRRSGEELTLRIEYSECADPQRLCSYVGPRAWLRTQEQLPSR